MTSLRNTSFGNFLFHDHHHHHHELCADYSYHVVMMPQGAASAPLWKHNSDTNIKHKHKHRKPDLTFWFIAYPSPLSSVFSLTSPRPPKNSQTNYQHFRNIWDSSPRQWRGKVSSPPPPPSSGGWRGREHVCRMEIVFITYNAVRIHKFRTKQDRPGDEGTTQFKRTQLFQ